MWHAPPKVPISLETSYTTKSTLEYNIRLWVKYTFLDYKYSESLKYKFFCISNVNTSYNTSV